MWVGYGLFSCTQFWSTKQGKEIAILLQKTLHAFLSVIHEVGDPQVMGTLCLCPQVSLFLSSPFFQVISCSHVNYWCLQCPCV